MFFRKDNPRVAELEGQVATLAAVRQALERSTAVIELSPDGGILAANDKFCALMGYRAEEVVGQQHRLFCDPAYAAGAEYSAFWSRLRAGESFSGAVRRIDRGGREVWLEATYSPVLDAQGRVSRIIKLASDVTARVLEAAKFRAMVDAIERSTAVIEFSVDGTVLRANPVFLQTFGYASGDVVGRHHKLFCPPEVVASPEYAAFWSRMASGEFFSGQFCRRHRNGSDVWLEASYNPVFGPDGKVTRVVKLASDITPRIAQQKAEQDSVAMAYEVAVETQGVAVHGEDVIRRTVEKIGAIAEIVERSGSLVQALGEQTKGITSIVNTIKEIADQTNLLALNAAIEAARAGESGRGFAVVADEVRKLAERTSGATGEISQMIVGIQSETNSVTASMATGSVEVAQGVELANDAGQSIARMRDGAQRVVGVIEELSATVRR